MVVERYDSARGAFQERGMPAVYPRSTSGLTWPMRRSIDSTSNGAGCSEITVSNRACRSKPLRELFRRPVPEGDVVLHVRHRRPVVLHRGPPDPGRPGPRIVALIPSVNSISEGSRPTSRAVLPEDIDLVTHRLDGAHAVPHVGVPRHRAQRLLLARSADHDRQVRLDRDRVVDRRHRTGSDRRART